MTVEQLLNSLSGPELVEWMAYFDLERDSQQPSDEDALKKAFNCG